MLLAGDLVIVAMIALMVLLLVAGAEAMWRRRGRLAHAQYLPRRPAAGVERDLSTIIAVYRTDPVMVVGETAEGALLERSLHELADRHDLLPPRLWQVLVEEYHIFQVR
jgi:hypothetical protein